MPFRQFDTDYTEAAWAKHDEEALKKIERLYGDDDDDSPENDTDDDNGVKEENGENR